MQRTQLAATGTLESATQIAPMPSGQPSFISQNAAQFQISQRNCGDWTGYLRYHIGVISTCIRKLLPLALLALVSLPMFSQTESAKQSQQSLPLPQNYAKLLHASSQAMVVTTPDWNSVDGSLQRYEKRNGKWQPVGEKIAIVVGKSGMGWDHLVIPAPSGAPIKKEGDGRSPAGIFTIGQAFGYAPSAPDLKLPYLKLPYLQLTDSIECVDDVGSKAYNQVVDRQTIAHPDWSSSEKMRSVDVYLHGLEVNYNPEHVAGAGSCIFMHIWRGTGRGTAGCTAMDQNKLQEILHWLDASKKPVLIQFPAETYDDLKLAWKLP
jgi:D-alanyl-D-alanine dipeptidase